MFYGTQCAVPRAARYADPKPIYEKKTLVVEAGNPDEAVSIAKRTLSEQEAVMIGGVPYKSKYIEGSVCAAPPLPPQKPQRHW